MSFSFDGSPTYWLTTETPVAAAPLTIACWAKLTVGDADCFISLADSGTANNIFSLEITGTGNGSARAQDAANTGNAFASGFYTDGEWSHFAAVFESSASRYCYVDGNVGPQNTTSVTPASVDRICIGARGDLTPSSDFTGNGRDFAVWSKALSAAEIQLLAAGESPLNVAPDNLVFYSPFASQANGVLDQVAGVLPTITGNETWSVDDPTLLPEVATTYVNQPAQTPHESDPVATIEDCTIDFNFATSTFNGTTIEATSGLSPTKKILMRLPCRTIPANAIIESASLALKQTGGSGGVTLSVKRLHPNRCRNHFRMSNGSPPRRGWVESEATWNKWRTQLKERQRCVIEAAPSANNFTLTVPSFGTTGQISYTARDTENPGVSEAANAAAMQSALNALGGGMPTATVTWVGNDADDGHAEYYWIDLDTTTNIGSITSDDASVVLYDWIDGHNGNWSTAGAAGVGTDHIASPSTAFVSPGDGETVNVSLRRLLLDARGDGEEHLDIVIEAPFFQSCTFGSAQHATDYPVWTVAYRMTRDLAEPKEFLTLDLTRNYSEGTDGQASLEAYLATVTDRVGEHTNLESTLAAKDRAQFHGVDDPGEPTLPHPPAYGHDETLRDLRLTTKSFDPSSYFDIEGDQGIQLSSGADLEVVQSQWCFLYRRLRQLQPHLTWGHYRLFQRRLGAQWGPDFWRYLYDLYFMADEIAPSVYLDLPSDTLPHFIEQVTQSLNGAAAVAAISGNAKPLRCWLYVRHDQDGSRLTEARWKAYITSYLDLGIERFMFWEADRNYWLNGGAGLGALVQAKINEELGGSPTLADVENYIASYNEDYVRWALEAIDEFALGGGGSGRAERWHSQAKQYRRRSRTGGKASKKSKRPPRIVRVARQPRGRSIGKKSARPRKRRAPRS